MKRLITALVTTVLLMALLVSPVLAWGGDADTGIDVSSIDAPSQGYLGDTVTASGTVTITSTADAGFLSLSAAESDAWYSVSNPDSAVVDSGSHSESDFGIGLFHSDADASQTFSWSTDITLDAVGAWTVEQGGSAFAQWYQLFWHGSSGDLASNSITINAYPRPNSPNAYIFRIKFPDGTMSNPFVQYGKLSTPKIDVNNGVWRVQIDSGTILKMSDSPYSQIVEVVVIGADGTIPYFVAQGKITITKL